MEQLDVAMHIVKVGEDLDRRFALDIPYESRKPIMPKPASMAVQAHPPSSRSYIRIRAEKMSSLFTRALPVTPSSFANMFIISSLSLSVLICLKASSSRKFFKAGALIKFPFTATQMPYGKFAKNGY